MMVIYKYIFKTGVAEEIRFSNLPDDEALKDIRILNQTLKHAYYWVVPVYGVST
jgi:hypothetical protein